MRAELLVPSGHLKNPSEFHTVLKMLFYLTDQVAGFKMSGANRTRAEKERLAYENLRTKESQKEKQEVNKIFLYQIYSHFPLGNPKEITRKEGSWKSRKENWWKERRSPYEEEDAKKVC